jgi:multiple sugar transport system ATP-binding protein
MPKILLLDEPLSNLDARLRLQTREEIRRIQRATGITTVFVTHDQEEAMSISDRIVVMKDGVVQQIGKPQQVYDDPVNLFVATFLGTPPINVFDAKVSGGKLYIGDAAVLDTHLPDGDVTAAVRPEGFIPDENGPLVCGLNAVEVMGRDITLVCRHDACPVPIRAIVDAEHAVAAGTVGFRLKENKVFLFDRQTGKRL